MNITVTKKGIVGKHNVIFIVFALVLFLLCISIYFVNGFKVQNAFANSTEDQALYSVAYEADNATDAVNRDPALVKPVSKNNDLPSYYSSLDEGYCTPLRDQGMYDISPAFASVAAIECSILREGLASASSLDLSERQVIDCFWNKKGVADKLGHIAEDYVQVIQKEMDATAYKGYVNYLPDTDRVLFSTSCWNGLVDESEAPYSDYLDLEEGNTDNLAWMQIVANAGKEDEENLKQYGFNSWTEYNTKYIEVLENYRLDNDFFFNKNSYNVESCKEYIYSYDDVDSNNEVINSDRIKQDICDHGAVTIMYYENLSDREDNTYYNAENNCFYDNKNIGHNYAVAIVGWDDSFSKDNFNEGCMPPYDGAWLVKNSWGGRADTDYCHEGYFWMSYYSLALITNSYVSVYDVKAADNYDNIYQYDGTVGSMVRIWGKDKSFANVFTASANENGSELLESINFFVYEVSYYEEIEPRSFKVQIYKDLSNISIPDSGTPCYESPMQVTVNDIGYVKIKLDEPILIPDGQTYSIVLTNISDEAVNMGLSVSYQIPAAQYEYFADVKPNQSFMTSTDNVNTWVDLAQTSQACARIKAYTHDVYEINYSGEISDEFLLNRGETITLPTCPDFGYEYKFKINGEPYNQPTYTPNCNSEIVVTKVYINYKINYDLDGGINNPENLEAYHFDTGYVELKTPTKENYVFLGWINNTDADDGQKYFGFNSMDMLKDVSVKAIFAKSQGTTQVEFPVTKTDVSDFNLRADGNLAFDVADNDNVELLFSEIDKGSSEAADVIKALNVNNEVIALFKVELKINGEVVHDGFGDINLHFVLGSSYDGNTFNLYHLHNDSTNTLNTQNVEGGIIQTTVSDLSPFCIEKYVEVPSPVQPDVPIYTDGASTSDNNMPVCIILIAIIVLCSGLLIKDKIVWK